MSDAPERYDADKEARRVWRLTAAATGSAVSLLAFELRAAHAAGASLADRVAKSYDTAAFADELVSEPSPTSGDMGDFAVAGETFVISWVDAEGTANRIRAAIKASLDAAFAAGAASRGGTKLATADEVQAAFDDLTDEERCGIANSCCIGCGGGRPCSCQNDE